MVLGAYRQVVGWRDDLKTLTAARQATNEREAKLQADGRKEASYYVEPAKIPLGAFSGPWNLDY